MRIRLVILEQERTREGWDMGQERTQGTIGHGAGQDRTWGMIGHGAG